MSTAADLRKFAQELRPIVDRGLDDAEIVKGLRQAATDKGIDWSQLKALVKAQAQDARDDGDRVEKLVAKAEFASAYADMLGANMNDKSNTRSSSDDGLPTADDVKGILAAPIKPRPPDAPRAAAPIADGLDIPPYLDRRQRVPA